MTKEERHRLEVILEDMNGKFDLLLEGHAALDRKIDRVQAESLERHTEAMSLIKTVHDSLNEKIGGVEQRLDAKIDGVEQRLDAKIDGVEQRLDAKIDGVEQRLDAKIDGVEQRLDAKIDSVRDELKEEIQIIGEKVDGHEARITALEQKAA